MDSHFFGEWVYFDNDEEKEDAYKYLSLWKKFILKRLPNMQQVGADQIILKNSIESFSGEKSSINTLGIKIEMKGKLPKNVLTKKQAEEIFNETKSP